MVCVTVPLVTSTILCFHFHYHLFSQDSNFEKALHGIEHLQKLNSSDLEEGGSVGAGSELEDEGEDILAAGSLEEALEVSQIHSQTAFFSLIPRFDSSLLPWRQSY